MSTSTNPGCLSAIAQLFGGKSKPSKSEPSQPEPEFIPEAAGIDPFPYRVRDDFLSHAEQSFYLVLKNLLGEQFTICPKVSLSDVFFVTRPNENRSANNRINRKHVDFLVCDPRTMKPRFAVELDDSSHQRPDREERDDFVDGVFHAANLPLFHIPVRNAYNTSELGVLFRQVIAPEMVGAIAMAVPAALSSPQQATSISNNQQVPICPKCGVPMLMRTASKGDQAGKRFYGCTNFPRCREIVNISG